MQAELLEQRPLIEQYLKETRQPLSAFSFINIFAWKDFFDFEIKKIDGSLCIFASEARNKAGTFLYLPPLGKTLKPETVDQCFQYMQQCNNGVGRAHAHGVSRVENVPFEQLSLFPVDRFKRLSKGQEYCYFRKDLTALQGNAYKSKRSDYNFFTKNYAAKYQPFAIEDKGECLALYDQWSARRKKGQRGEAYLYMLEDNRRVQEAVFEHYEELGLVGRVVRVKDNIVGYTFGYTLTQKIFCVLFEIADLDFKGLPVYIFREFCADPQVALFSFINAMDDFALENIQKTKLSFRPKILFSSYVITPQLK